MSVVGLLAAMVMNRAGIWKGVARTAILAILLTGILLVVQARDGFRSHAMNFPGVVVDFRDVAGSLLLPGNCEYRSIVGSGIGNRGIHGIGRVTPPVRTPTNYSSVFYVDLVPLVLVVIGSRIARDAHGNVLDLRATIDPCRQRTSN
jgi:hypothetical protein